MIKYPHLRSTSFKAMFNDFSNKLRISIRSHLNWLVPTNIGFNANFISFVYEVFHTPHLLNCLAKHSFRLSSHYCNQIILGSGITGLEDSESMLMASASFIVVMAAPVRDTERKNFRRSIIFNFFDFSVFISANLKRSVLNTLLSQHFIFIIYKSIPIPAKTVAPGIGYPIFISYFSPSKFSPLTNIFSHSSAL